MAEKRMFTQKIIDSDSFLEMPLSAQALYFHLNMRADDDGFVNNPKKITKMVNASEDDLKILLMKRFLIGFDSGVIVIKHWRMHNTLKADRYHPTDYQDEFAQLGIKPNKAYTDDPLKIPPPSLPAGQPASSNGTEVETPRKQGGSTSEPQKRIDIEESREDLGSEKPKKKDVFSAFAAGDDALLKALVDFEKMRKSIGKPLSDRARTMLLNKLQTFPRHEWIPILEQSIFNDWQGIFPLSNSPLQKQSESKGSRGQSSASAMINLMKEGAFGDS